MGKSRRRVAHQGPISADERAYREVVAALETWDGTEAASRALGLRLRELPALEAPPRDPQVRWVLGARDAYRAGTRSIDLAHRPELLAPLLGDPSFLDHQRFGDESALEWITPLTKATPVTDAVREFLWTLFEARPRRLWIAASRALVGLSSRDPTTLQRLSARWERDFPSGLPEAYPENLPRGVNPRHTLHAGCTAFAQGLPFPGFDLARFLNLRLGSDEANASAYLISLKELLGSGPPGPIHSAVAQKLDTLRPDPQTDAALREIVEALEAADCATHGDTQSILDWLARPHWRKTTGTKAPVDCLYSFAETAQWLKARNDLPRLAAIRANAAEAAATIALCVDDTVPAPHAVAALVERLRLVLDPSVRATEPPLHYAAAVVEVLLLAKRPEVAKVPWTGLLARAGIPTEGEPDTVVPRAARRSLLRHLALASDASRGSAVPATLLRGSELDETELIDLSASKNNYVAKELGLQAERLLRSLPVTAERVKLLWRILRHDPKAQLFKLLRRELRGKEPTLAALVGALATLEERRDVGAAPTELIALAATAYHSAARCLPESEQPEAARALNSLVVALRGFSTALEERRMRPADVGWETLYAETLFGPSAWTGEPATKPEGLIGAMSWAIGDRAPSRAEVQASFNQFVKTLATVRSAGDAVGVELCRNLEQAANTLFDHVRELAWPEAATIELLVREVTTWTEERRAAALASKTESDHCHQILALRDEAQALRYVAPEGRQRLERLPTPDLTRLGYFFLNHLRLAAAHRLHMLTRHRAPVPSPWAYLTPLGAGVTSGPLLVLDGGVALAEGTAGYPGFTTLVALAMAAVVLFAGFSSRGAGSGSWRSGAKVRFYGRVGLLFCAAFMMSILTSLAVLLGASVSDELRSIGGVLVWSSLALFFGLFLGLVLQGRAFAQGDHNE